MIFALIGGVAFAVLYWFPIRRWFASWGTTPVDRRRAMPGDVAVVDPTYLATLAITIDAAIWQSMLRPYHSADRRSPPSGTPVALSMSLGSIAQSVTFPWRVPR